jgi:hypothetical protein
MQSKSNSLKEGGEPAFEARQDVGGFLKKIQQTNPIKVKEVCDGFIRG